MFYYALLEYPGQEIHNQQAVLILEYGKALVG